MTQAPPRRRPRWIGGLALALVGLAAALPAADAPADLARAIEELEPRALAPDAPAALRAELGRLYARAGRVDESWRWLAPLAASPTAEAELLLDAGRVALATGRDDEARQLLARAAEAAPETEAGRLLGLAEIGAARYAEGYPWLRAWLRTHPEDENVRIPAALAALRLGRTGEAEALLAPVTSSTPPVRLLRAEILLDLRRADEALALLQPIPAIFPKGLRVPWLRLMATALIMTNAPREAAAVLDGETESSAGLSVLRAHALSQLGELEEAIREVEPDAASDLAARQELGRLLTLAGRHAEAVPVLETAVAEAPSDRESWQFLARSRFATGAAEAAREAAAEAARLEEVQADVAEEERRRFTRINDPVAAALQEAQALGEAGKRTEALARIRAELRLVPDDGRLWLAAGALLQAVQDREEALAAAERALALSPERADAWLLRARARAALGLEGVEDDLRRALAVSPEHPGAVNALATHLATTGRTSEARSLLESFLAGHPDNRVARDNLARLLADGER